MSRQITRRDFLQQSAGIGAAASGLCLMPTHAEETKIEPFTFGLVTDLHYADKPKAGSRYYRDSVAKLEQCVTTLNENKLAFTVQVGDFIDKAPDKSTELGYLKTIRKTFDEYKGEKYFVLGNHDLATLSKSEFLGNCGATIEKSFHSFDKAGFHFVILDANFLKDGTPYDSGNYNWTDTWIHTAQREWLADDLKQAADKKALVFVHQNLHDEKNAHGIKNAPLTRKVLEEAGNVLAVFQGHDHRGAYKQIEGIHYFVLKALVEGPTLKNNSYGVVSIDAENKISIDGFGRQEDRSF
jgi:3',5'-cyclic AMP phosphodiesterase CpdA